MTSVRTRGGVQIKSVLRSVIRRAVRHAVPFVSNRPWLVSLAARAFAMSPSLKYRVRRIMAPSFAAADLRSARGDRALTAAEAAVLSDLRDAIALRKNSR